MKRETTTEPVRAGNTQNCLPEFGRCQDVTRLFGLKRGTLYNLLQDGKIRGCLLRIRGAKSGVRLFHLGSIRALIDSRMQQSSEPAAFPRQK